MTKTTIKWMLFAALFTTAMMCLSLLLSGCAYDAGEESAREGILDEIGRILTSTSLGAKETDGPEGGYRLIHVESIMDMNRRAEVYVLIYDRDPDNAIWLEKAVIVLGASNVDVAPLP